jgi:hypothetical protein
MTEIPERLAPADEFDVLAARAGLVVPAGRRKALVASYEELLRMLELLRQPREASAEPAGIFDVRSVVRRH